MWLIIAEPTDYSSLWIYTKLKEKGLENLDLVLPEELFYCLHCDYKVSSNASEFKFVLHDNHIIESKNVEGIINRMLVLPINNKFSLQDQGYVQEEMNAFFLGWMTSLDIPQLNKPEPYGFVGKWRSQSEWIWLASKSGLKTIKYDYSAHLEPGNLSKPSDSQTINVFALDGEILNSNLPSEIEEDCIRFADITSTRMLEIEFMVDEKKNYLFSNASPFPNITLGGEQAVEKIYTILKEGDNIS